MNLLYFVAAINLLSNQLNCVVLVPSNKFELNFSEQIGIENDEHDDERKISHLSHGSKDKFEFCKDEEYQHQIWTRDKKYQMIWVRWNRTKAGDYAVLPNMCSVDNGLPLRRRCHHYFKRVEWEGYDTQAVLIDCRRSLFCKADAFDHYVVQISGEIARHQNIWKEVKVGEYSFLRDLCLLPNGLHLTRKCYYDAENRRARWASVDHLKDIKCLQHIRQRAISSELNLLHENITTSKLFLQKVSTRRQVATNLWSLLKQPAIKLLPTDIQLISDILETITIDSYDIELSRDLLNIVNNIMSTDPVVLRISAEVNATNALLETFENYLDGLTEIVSSKESCHVEPQEVDTATSGNDTSVKVLNSPSIGVTAHITRNISVFFISPACAQITGIAIYDSYQKQLLMTKQQYQMYYDSINDLHYRFIYMNESVTDLLNETKLELATFIPTDVWRAIERNCFQLHLDASVIVFKIYAHDGLFVERNLYRSRKPLSKILSISLPGYTHELPGRLPFILRRKGVTHNLRPNTNTGCGYWNYSTWVTTGIYTNLMEYSTSNLLMLCFTNHLTQFSYLIGGSYRQADLSDAILVTSVHQRALDIIALIGCSLSLLGLLGIWVTALLFKKWRSEASNKILLNMCVVMTLQMALFLFVNTDDVSKSLVEHHSYTKCIILGALMQYVLLVLFTWMFIVAVMQFQRYVKVIGIRRSKHYIMKSALLAWSVPFIPTLLVALLNPKSYIPTTYELATGTGVCYPSGYGLHFGVLLPVSVIILANLSIFVYIFYSISHTLRMSAQRHEKHIVIKQIRLSILLFFLLGLSWIFGIFSFMQAGIAFSYLFCLTASLQGFVLFIYFVIINENARNSWQMFVCPTRAKRALKKNTEMQSMTTAATLLTQEQSTSRLQ